MQASTAATPVAVRGVPAGLVKLGLAVIAAAVAGWLVTLVAVAFAAGGGEVEDLTDAWRAAGPTPLGRTATVVVPADQTLVAFLVGTGLNGFSGTTAGTCAASVDGTAVTLEGGVHVNRSLTGVLTAGEETVAVAGWRPPSDAAGPTTVSITCDAIDSGVEHFVAVPSTTARLAQPPWFQPWGWAALALAGLVLVGLGIARAAGTGAVAPTGAGD